MKKILAILLITVMVFTLLTACGSQTSKPDSSQPAPAEKEEKPVKEEAKKEQSNLEKSLAIDVSGYKATDGNPLFMPLVLPDKVERPADPEKLPENDSGRWFDYEFPYNNVKKVDLPKSPADGCIGKKIIILKNGDHPYHTAYNNAAIKAGEVFGMKVEVMSPNWDVNVQTQQVDQAINAKPDLIIYLPVDQKASAQHLRKIHQAGIPVMGSNVYPDPEGMKYLIGWVGPHDWGQTRLLAQKLAEKCNYEGGYGVIGHAPGGSAYYARVYGMITELAKIAPKMKLLDIQAPGFEAEKVKQVVSDWITKYGDELKMIATSETTAQAIGSIEACEKAGRTDIVIGGIDNSKIAMDLVKQGKLYACTYQPPEQDGAIAVQMAADWFNGKEIPSARYMTPHVITAEDADKFMPAQW